MASPRSGSWVQAGPCCGLSSRGAASPGAVCAPPFAQEQEPAENSSRLLVVVPSGRLERGLGGRSLTVRSSSALIPSVRRILATGCFDEKLRAVNDLGRQTGESWLGFCAHQGVAVLAS